MSLGKSVVSVVPLVVGLSVCMGILSACMASMAGVVWFGVLLLVSLVLWWVEDGLESVSGVVGSGFVDVVAWGVILFISSEALFFLGALVSGLYLLEEGWKEAWVAMDFSSTPLWISVVLLSSGVSVTQFHESLMTGYSAKAGLWMGVTVLLGFGFLMIQFEEWSEILFSASTGVGGGVFFFITGFHGLHVVVGSLLNLGVWFGVWLGAKRAVGEPKVEGVIWYWHFVDVVWLFVLLGLYWLMM
uniref:Cytochrome c oxidase subunit 3 n=1 Tax=Longicollum sp. (in: thorny-headed worms) TaxID=3073164 RepID=A0AA52HNE8_9BILA|nr:cytochrome c oxidase subunit 3 [Longicollum sp. (in: thorny-headed worms)]